jgi:hypothetical protein
VAIGLNVGLQVATRLVQWGAGPGSVAGALVGGGLGLISFAASVTAIISFLMWTHLSVRRVHALGMMRHVSPEWAVGCWFIPFVSMVKPYEIMSETAGCLEVRSHARVGWWWVCYLGNGIIGGLSAAMVAFSLARGRPSEPGALALIGLVLSVTAGVLAILMLGIVERAAWRRSAELSGEG